MVTMENLNTQIITGNHDLNKLKEIRDAATKQIKRLRDEKTIRIPAYVPAELRESLDRAVEYAFIKGFIKKPTRWGLAKFALANTITLLINQKEQEDMQKAIAAQYESPNIPPNEIIPTRRVDFLP